MVNNRLTNKMLKTHRVQQPKFSNNNSLNLPNLSGAKRAITEGVGAYRFPKLDGSTNYIMVTDGEGNVTWSGTPSFDSITLKAPNGETGTISRDDDRLIVSSGSSSLGMLLKMMVGHQIEGYLRLGRTDGNVRYHDLKSYVSSTAASNYLKFSVHNGTINSTTDVMSLKGNGNVGIGETVPLQKLHVNGNILLNNNQEFRWKDSAGTERTCIELTNANDMYIGGSFGGSLVFVGGGSYTERMRVNDTGDIEIGSGNDLFFTGDGSGLPYGSCYGNHIGWSQAAATQNIWYNISDADIADGELNAVTHDGDGELTVLKAGRYLINYTVCEQTDAANIHIETGIEVTNSGSANAAGQSHTENKFANEEEHVSGTCILDLAANDTIEVAIRTTDAGTPTISVQGVNITATHIGGT